MTKIVTGFIRPRAARAALALIAAGSLSVACADKDLLPTSARSTTGSVLIRTEWANQTAGTTANWLLVGLLTLRPENESGSDDDGDFAILGYKFTPLVQGSQAVTVSFDLAPCLALTAARGKEGCEAYVWTFILADTFDVASDYSPEANSFDNRLEGPFQITPGSTPTIPVINLSASRFGVVRWEGDEALQMGGLDAPQQFSGVPGSPLVGPHSSGVVNSDGSVTLYGLTAGQVLGGGPGTPSVPHLAIFRNGLWTKVAATSANPNSLFYDVAGLSSTEVYMGAPNGIFMYNGSSISRVLTNVTDTIFGIAATTTATGAKVLAAGTQGAVWIGSPTSMSRFSLPLSQRADQVCVVSQTEAWASSSVGGGVFRFNGSSWISVPPPSNASKIDMFCPQPNLAYVIANTVGAYFFSGGTWQNVTMTGVAAPSIRLIRHAPLSLTEKYASGDSALIDRAFYRYINDSWQEVGRKRFVQPRGRIWADPRGGAAYQLSTYGRVERITQSAATVLGYVPSLRDVFVNSATSAFAVGQNAALLRWDGTKWNADAPPGNVAASRTLQGVWSNGPSNAWAVGNQSTIFRYNGTSWTAVSHVGAPVGQADNYNGVFGVGTDVWAVGDTSIIRCGGAGGCVNQPSGGVGPLNGIWGSSATNLIAVGGGGRITRYNGTSWSPMQSGTSRNLARVSGTGPNDVWAVGDSVLLHFDGTSWSNVPMTGDLEHARSRVPSGLQLAIHVGLWAKAPNEVYLGSEFRGITRWDGREWHRMTPDGEFPHRVMAIHGAPGGCALAVTESQSNTRAVTLYRGIGPSGCFASPMPALTAWP